MPKLNFKPTLYLVLTYFCTIGITISNEDGEVIVRSAMFDEHGVQKTKVTRATIRFDREGHPYFTKNHQRYYLNDFIKKSPF